MAKQSKTVAAFLAQNTAKEKVLNSLRKKLASNSLSEEAKADAEALIAEKEAEVQAIKDLVAELEAGEEDKSEELKAKIAELTAKVAEVENSLKAPRGLLRVQNFIDSKNGAKSFLSVVKNSMNGEEFKANWKAELTKNGITPNDLMLPPAVVSVLTDTWENTAENFLQLLDVTGLYALKVAYDNNDAETSRAQGHKKGTAKNEQVLNFVPKELRPQMIYKYITIDRETLDFEDRDGVLATYVARELASRILHELMRAVLVGDGREAAADNKISKVESIARAATDVYVTVSNAAGDKPTIDEVAEAIDSITAEGDIVLFVSKQTARSLAKFISGTGATTQYNSLTDLAMELGVAEIRTTKLLNEAATDAIRKPRAIAFVGKAYKVVGDLTMQGFEDFILSYNKKEFLTEIYAGGGLSVPGSGAVVMSKLA